MTDDTKADFFSYFDVSGDAEADQDLLYEKARELVENGAVWLRCTSVNKDHEPSSDISGYWLEGWIKRPQKDPIFACSKGACSSSGTSLGSGAARSGRRPAAIG